jgi:hypothetical protein
MNKDKLWLLVGIVMISSLVLACVIGGIALVSWALERQSGNAGAISVNNTPLASSNNTSVPPVEKIPAKSTPLASSGNTPVPPASDNPSAIISKCVPPPPGLIIWLPGDGNTDDIARHNYGLANGRIAFVPGKVGQAFDFNGTDSFIALPDADKTQNFDGFSELTIQAWIKPKKVESVGIVTKYDSRLSNGDSYYLDIRDGRLRLGVYLGITSSSGATYKSTGAVVSPGVFAHVAGVWKGGVGFALYVNGVEVPGTLDSGQVVPTQMANNDVPVNIGRFQSDIHGSPFGYFDGGMDEVSVYNRALTASEIQEVFAADQAGMCKSPYQ